MMAFDHLSSVDVGRAPMPPSRGLAPERAGPLVRPRLVAAAASGFVVVAASAWIGLSAIAPGLLGAGTAGPSTDQEVLGGVGAGGSVIPEPTPGVSLGGVTSESGAATPKAGSETAAAPTPAGNATPVFVATPVPTEVQPPPMNPPPSVPQSVAPTQSPSRAATPTPSPTPTPTPAPDPPECSDGIDNDGDSLIDFGLDPLVNDPGCVSPDDDSEGDLP
jgi:hypothetical protein